MHLIEVCAIFNGYHRQPYGSHQMMHTSGPYLTLDFPCVSGSGQDSDRHVTHLQKPQDFAEPSSTHIMPPQTWRAGLYGDLTSHRALGQLGPIPVRGAKPAVFWAAAPRGQALHSP